MTKIYCVNGDNPELVAESNLLPEEAITAHRNSNGFNSQIIHIGGSIYSYVTVKGLFYARKAR